MNKLYKIIADLRDNFETTYSLKIWEYDVAKETPQSIVVLNPIGEEKRYFTKTLFVLNKDSENVKNIHVSTFSTEEKLEETIEIVKKEITNLLEENQKKLATLAMLHQRGPSIERRKVFTNA